MSELGNGNTDRLLGSLLAQAMNLEKRLDNIETDIKQRRIDHDKEMSKLRECLANMKLQGAEVKGGRKMLAALLSASAVAGALVLELLKYVLTLR